MTSGRSIGGTANSGSAWVRLAAVFAFSLAAAAVAVFVVPKAAGVRVIALSSAPTRGATPPPSSGSQTTTEDVAALAARALAGSPNEVVARIDEGDPVPLEEQWSAVLGAWGKLDPVAAVAWAIQHDTDTSLAVAAVLTAAAQERPGLAVDLSRCLLTLDPEAYTPQASALLVALTRAGNFAEAVRLATGVPYASSAGLTERAFAAWAEEAPAAALRAVDQIPSARLRRIAFAATLAGWARSDPAALANYAEKEFDGDARTLALHEANARRSGLHH